MSCSKDKDEIANTDWSQFQSQVLLLPIQELSDSERANLLFVREEEKLARDVYQTLYKKWGRNIFGNIASSEQTHMDAILILLDKYQIPDPASGKNVGEFSNASLQQLYFNLVNLGNNSLPDALKVGATIEDLDIFDIKSMMLETDNQDVLLVFSNLTKGSRNHLRSFYKNILNVGGEYDAQYISQTELEAIVNSPMETGW
jgi:hypothetical protein